MCLEIQPHMLKIVQFRGPLILMPFARVMTVVVFHSFSGKIQLTFIPKQSNFVMLNNHIFSVLAREKNVWPQKLTNN